MGRSNPANKIISHVAASGSDDVLRRPFFCDRWDEGLLRQPGWRDFLIGQIGTALTQNPVSVGGLCHIAVPKSRYTFRTISHMSLIDTLKYTALVFSIGKEIEKHRLARTVVFSNRFDARRWSLDRTNYDLFRKESKRLSLSPRYKIKIITDLSNFYDRLNLHKLENLLREIGCDASTVSKLNAILIQWSQQQSFGLPVGSDASRLLAEAMLINADKELAAHRIKFIRYVDDYRIFSASQEKAYEAMQLLDRSLRREGLFLNSGKTKLIDLTLDSHEEEQEDAEFKPIDEQEKIEQTKIIQSRYSSRIAKYYRFPGKEAILRLREIKLGPRLEEIRDPCASEEDLKTFVKACIYSPRVRFSYLDRLLNIYPHLIPYVVDAIAKEHIQNPERFDARFLKEASKKFRGIFCAYARNDYFRVQALRLLCTIDKDCGEFLTKELLTEHQSEVVFAQSVYFLAGRIPRARLLDIMTKFQSYGSFTRTSLAFILARELVLQGEERRALMRNLARSELDPFIGKLLKG